MAARTYSWSADDTLMLNKAIGLAVHSHWTQIDEAGLPYILHPLRVMETTIRDGGTVEEACAAVLHDVLEDTDASPTYLRQNFGMTVFGMVTALTRAKDESYQQFIVRCKAEGVAKLKLADLRDNLRRPSKQFSDPADQKRHNRRKHKYGLAVAYLTNKRTKEEYLAEKEIIHEA